MEDNKINVQAVKITQHNKKILNVLVDNCFPITYSEEFYESVPVLYKDFSNLYYHFDLPIGGVVARVEE